MFIIWDKLFGTFAEEDEEPRYGLTRQLESHSFLWQHFHYLVELGYAVALTPGLAGKVKLIFGRPADFDPAFRARAEKGLLVIFTTYFFFPHPTIVLVLSLLTFMSLAGFTSLQRQYLRRLYGGH
ncbi:hypothetical protein [Dyadobacter sandarakinus]|uniref:Uncharacterized protein n=1 Tax=Dyadobacter sandarakinus TaxID=2747268 RepID=A0ABX7I1W7_9BACT|nr:hypothetical protein [Dyadobacter sandarakinus]QRQ99803.1 hypothetical protein HWI92_02145 [Dyadobacter sandarakinus]